MGNCCADSFNWEDYIGEGTIIKQCVTTEFLVTQYSSTERVAVVENQSESVVNDCFKATGRRYPSSFLGIVKSLAIWNRLDRLYCHWQSDDNYHVDSRQLPNVEDLFSDNIVIWIDKVYLSYRRTSLINTLYFMSVELLLTPFEDKIQTVLWRLNLWVPPHFLMNCYFVKDHTQIHIF